MKLIVCVVLAIVTLLLAKQLSHLEQDFAQTLSLLEEEINTLNTVTSIKVEVDDGNSNTGFFQFLVTPGGLVNNLQVSAVVREGDTRTYSIPPCGWDAQRYIVFCLGIPDTVAQMDTPMTVNVYLRDGSSVTGNIQYTGGASFTSAINPQTQFDPNPPTPGTPTTPGNPSNPPQNPNTPSSSVPIGKPTAEIKKLINIIKAWKEPAGGPAAQIGTPGPSHSNADWDLLQKHKIMMDDILTRMGITDLKTKSALFAIFGIETERMYLPDGMCEGDRSKTGPSTNYSPANMNYDMIINKIKYPGINKKNIGKLNHRSNLKLAIQVAIRAIVKLGIQGFINFHRAGRTGFEKPKKCDPCAKMTEFRQGFYNAVLKYMEDPTIFREGNKVWVPITWIGEKDLCCCMKNPHICGK